MIGQTIRSRRRMSAGVVLLVVWLAAMVAAGAALGQPGWFLAAAFPLLFACNLWLAQPRPVVIHFTEKHIDLGTLPPIPYDAIQSIRPLGRGKADPDAPPRRRRFAIEIVHRDGAFLVPPLLDAPSDDVYRFLLGRLTPSGAREVGPHLTGYLMDQEDRFGASQVFSYRARAHLGSRPAAAAVSACGLALFMTGLIWLAAAYAGVPARELWFGLSFVLGLIGVFTAVVGWLERNVNCRVKNWRQSALVVGPGGLAMTQGEIRGELRWDQVQDVKYRPKPGFFDFAVGTERQTKGISVRVAGAAIVIADVYDRPLFTIYKMIATSWVRYR